LHFKFYFWKKETKSESVKKENDLKKENDF